MLEVAVSMKRDRRSGEGGHHQRGPDLPTRTQDWASFRQNIPYPSDSEESFARHHAERYGDEELLVDGQHTGSPHFPRRSERARIHAEYTTSNRQRDRTREAYGDTLKPATEEYESLSYNQREYYDSTSGGMLPRHHATLLPLARDREGPNYHNATNRERLLTMEYGYHSAEAQQRHWKSADKAYQEHEQVQADHARHRRFRSDPRDDDTVDCYSNSPVQSTEPHTRSRNQGLPPPGYYCDRLDTPPEEDDDGAGEAYGGR
ncbi:hypothetical protein HO133_002828 [Letharia lupina]|uniref:Uncharacterized protein n=1 Tax=Letharia lupina TaxID=560253 RepID=A0A8H6CBS6_9LECA|nr:uncharacterized protein HO133_002828 [Letharia lupina]KAF6220396.1 hypothetical protein HO133_002828 [Letharia lupina]